MGIASAGSQPDGGPAGGAKETWRDGYGERFVPRARDGSVFHPALNRGRGFRIGAKGSEFVVERFDEALEHLSRMDAPRWRRPNDAGAWGIVTGVEWVRLDNVDPNP